MATQPAFQRARTDEQRAQRRAEILAATRALLAERRVDEMSLNELARAVGLAKSNVLRYFESREAILLTILDEEYRAWLDELEPVLAQSRLQEPDLPRADRLAGAIATTMLARPLLCDLVAAAPVVLERNVATDTALAYKQSTHGAMGRLVAIAEPELGQLDRRRTAGVIAAVHAFVSLVWAATREPSPALEEAYRIAPELQTFRVEPTVAVRELLATFLVGLEHREPELPVEDGPPAA